MIICLCKNVSDRKVKLLIAEGQRNITTIQTSCDIGRGCGKCLTIVKSLLENEQGFLSDECCATSANRTNEGAKHEQRVAKKRNRRSP